jgi:hypothetical protein
MTKDIKYKRYSFRLSEEVKEELYKRRAEKNLSWNLFFKDLFKRKK